MKRLLITFRSVSDPREIRQFITSNPLWTPERCKQIISDNKQTGRVTVDIKSLGNRVK